VYYLLSHTTTATYTLHCWNYNGGDGFFLFAPAAAAIGL
jgi:hypothetical protein